MDNQIIPPSFLFQYSMAATQVSAIPRKKGGLLQLDDSTRLFVPSRLNNAGSHLGLKVAWNPEGIGIEVDVRGKKLPPTGRRSSLRTSDHLSISIDTRHTANVHRATEYCASVNVLPVDEDADDKPSVRFVEIAQQRAMKRDQDGRKCGVQCHPHASGYTLELWIPQTQLFGFDEAPGIGRIGFYCIVHDTELGELPLSIGDDFPTAFDPSTWLQLELRP